VGFSLTWRAVRVEDAETFFGSLQLSPTGEIEGDPSSLVTTARLDTGWQVLVYNEYECPFLQQQDLRRISSVHDVLLCMVEEHVMASSSEF
jgi:hypothetical protein